jgi:hypothetical protein
MAGARKARRRNELSIVVKARAATRTFTLRQAMSGRRADGGSSHTPRGARGPPHPVLARQVCPGDASVVVAVTALPFMVQMVGVPSAACSRMSALKSAL